MVRAHNIKLPVPTSKDDENWMKNMVLIIDRQGKEIEQLKGILNAYTRRNY
jgi:hypothetical protein